MLTIKKITYITLIMMLTASNCSQAADLKKSSTIQHNLDEHQKNPVHIISRTSYRNGLYGFWLGQSSNTAKFNIGDSTDFIKFSGTAISMSARAFTLNAEQTQSLLAWLGAAHARTKNSAHVEPQISIETLHFRGSANHRARAWMRLNSFSA